MVDAALPVHLPSTRESFPGIVLPANSENHYFVWN